MAYRLDHHPEPQVSSMSDLVGIAHAIEQEAIRRFRLLAAEMESRGHSETAEMFRCLAGEEERHASGVEAWAERISEPVSRAEGFVWRLPPEIASSWDEVRTSALLTPYRTLAVAVVNKERAFAFYSYVAAHATDPQVAAEAEKLAREELEHAALLRRWRRAAYRQSVLSAGPVRPPPRDLLTLADFVEEWEAEIAACHSAMSVRLEAAGDPDSAALLREMSRDQGGGPGSRTACPDPECRSEQPAALLTAAQKPLESLSEALESVFADGTDEELVRFAQGRLQSVVARIARIVHRREALIEAEDAGGAATARADHPHRRWS